MFGIPAGLYNPALLTAGRKPAPNPMMDMIAQSMKASQPQQPRAGVNALQGIGATLQDVGAALNGRQGSAVSRFQQANAAMRQSQDDARRRQLRFEQLRQTVPETDRQFWEAYALGGEEAAMAVRQSRLQAENEQYTLADGAQRRNGRGELIAENPRDEQAPEPTTLMRNVAAAGFQPGTPEFEREMRTQLQRATGNPTLAGVIAPILSQVMSRGEESLTPQQREAYEMYRQLNQRPPSVQDLIVAEIMGVQVPGGSAPASPAGPPRVNSEAEVSTLPPTVPTFIGPDGREYRNPNYAGG